MSYVRNHSHTMLFAMQKMTSHENTYFWKHLVMYDKAANYCILLAHHHLSNSYIKDHSYKRHPSTNTGCSCLCFDKSLFTSEGEKYGELNCANTASEVNTTQQLLCCHTP